MAAEGAQQEHWRGAGHGLKNMLTGSRSQVEVGDRATRHWSRFEGEGFICPKTELGEFWVSMLTCFCFSSYYEKV